MPSEASGTAHGWGFDAKSPDSGFGARVTLAALSTGGFGGSLFLIALGAIFRYAVTWEPAGVDIGTVGLILMIVGVVLFLLTLYFTLSARRPSRTMPR